MKNNPPGRSFLPLTIIFVVSSLLFVAASGWLAGRNVDYRVLLVGNTTLFLATGISFYLYVKALRDSKVQVFLRMMYSGLLIKMSFCLAATLLYVFLVNPVSKPAILGCFGLYILYTFAEVKILMRFSKKLPKNA